MAKNKDTFKKNRICHIIMFHIDALLYIIVPEETQSWFLFFMLFEASMIFFHFLLFNKLQSKEKHDKKDNSN